MFVAYKLLLSIILCHFACGSFFSDEQHFQAIWPNEHKGYHRTPIPKYFILSDEVKRGLEDGKAIVALESTVISHGMPFPANLETAMMLESIVKEHGSIPATIAILKGTIHVGKNC